MKVNIYYGGRGIIDDPALFVIDRMQLVLEELNVKVERFMLNELRSNVTALPQTIKTADGIILATTVEWFGIGGYLQTFLDACWLYGDKEKISSVYMCPVAMSTTNGEREALRDLSVAWEILGGRPADGICGYIPDTSVLENTPEYITLIEKRTENLYRTINQKAASFPASNKKVNQTVAINKNINLTPQESERLSQYAADESYVQAQKEDIKELASYYKGKLAIDEDEGDAMIESFKDHYKRDASVNVSYLFMIEDRKDPLFVRITGGDLYINYEKSDDAQVIITTDSDTIKDITRGKMTFQRAFMSTGKMKVKGEFKLVGLLDRIFVFTEEA